ncbi:DAK2 domain-containing protein [Streptomyces bacillaris]|uniref:DAK2 domain-containing protein n=1 Tax=Streptomyces TaxID=1883 RepID=UPI0002ECBF41|nr:MULTISPECIES: DAK2 domain-containing protein [Streptomyces]MYR38422.1 DAK2 domain-containing protein [Streptomyces sp. SID4944]MBT3072881.1 DAK2 domain-containing protein [Streptomyces sp. COG21]MBT3081291.1 DAK2 domain-containing protein [Streptomyces sp. COG20]MBT3088224.1 DAK2 domain-containing protein [Streptomyces sp. CYG21]MBT3102877.1 DAK2 domain-containing protein [Streptomyces sp. COG19]
MNTDARAVLTAFADAARTAHPALTALDQISGDGDFGDNLRDGLDRVGAALAAGPADPPFAVAAAVFLDEVGGTSGPLLGLLFQELARAHAAHPEDGHEAWRTGIREGLAAIQRVGEAEPGDRTLVDALDPAREALESGKGPGDVAEAALAGARATAELRARRGRASYVGERALGSPDPGALGVALLFWCRANAAGEAPGKLADHLPDPTGH